MALKIETFFVVSIMVILGLAIYLALLTPYMANLSVKTITLILASSLLVGATTISVLYLFHRIGLEAAS
jgi:hypothetical protein